jgi:ABC-type glycerol-3-phosphate transport system permease component
VWAATSVFSFVSAWNDFLFACSSFTGLLRTRTAAPGLRTGRSGEGLT